MATVLDIVTASLQALGAIQAGEEPSAVDAAYCFARFNDFVDACAAERLDIYTITRTTATLTANQASFTVGTGGNINIVRPVYLENVRFQDTSITPTLEYPLTELTDDSYAQLAQKGQTSTLPAYYYYNPTFTSGTGLGTLIPWPIPTSATLQWVIYAPTAIPQFAALTDTVALPPGYRRFLISNLALEIAPGYDKLQIAPSLVQIAQESKMAIKRANVRMRDLSLDPATLQNYLPGAGYSVLTGP